MTRKTMRSPFILFLLAALSAVALTGCSGQRTELDLNVPVSSTGESADTTADTLPNTSGEALAATGSLTSDAGPEAPAAAELPDIEVRFGENGPFLLKLSGNETAAELARNIPASGLNLPIYHYDDFEGYETMQYYDIPSRLDIPSSPEPVALAKAGEVYYSDPGRVILFYQDTEITGEYTRVGSLENTDGLKEAVENNPVAVGYGNKIISVRHAG